MPTTKTATTDVTPRPKRVRPSRSKAAVAARAAAKLDAPPAPGGNDVIDGPPASGPTPEDIAEAVAMLQAELEHPAMQAAIMADVPAEPRPPMPSEADVLAVESVPAEFAVATDPMERIQLAKSEWKALAAWWAEGGKPPRPAAPNLEALHAEANHAPGAKPRARKASAARPDGAAPRTRASITGIYRQAVDRKRQGPRGPGIKVTDDEYRAHLVTLNAEHPGLTGVQAQEVAHWVLGLAVSKGRTLKLWEEVVAS
jgi:hypothetical protein